MSRNSWSKLSARSHYFMLPYEIFSLNLSTGELAVYAYLLYLENRKTHECYPSYKTIGAAVGINSRNTVKNMWTCWRRNGSSLPVLQSCSPPTVYATAIYSIILNQSFWQFSIVTMSQSSTSKRSTNVSKYVVYFKGSTA